MPSLKKLHLALNQLSDASAKALSENISLRTFDLYANNISDIGALTLANTQALEELQILGLLLESLGFEFSIKAA